LFACWHQVRPFEMADKPDFELNIEFSAGLASRNLNLNQAKT
jgi:hypothetical protein